MYEPLVSEEEFRRAGEIREERAEKMPNTHPVLTRFSGLMKCGHCGCGVSRRSTSGKKLWQCNVAERKGIASCGIRRIYEEELEEAAVLAVGKISDAKFRRLVQQIVLYNDRIEFQMAEGKTKSILRQKKYPNGQDEFTRKVFCGTCGKPLQRKAVRNGRKKRAFLCQNPQCPQHPKKLPESDFKQVAEEMLRTSDCETAFTEHVRRAVVSDSTVTFEFKDGRVKTWQRK